MKTITIDNKKYIPARIVMLPNKGDIINPLVILRNDGVLVFYDETFHRIRMAHQEFGDFEIQNASYQHLYLVCDLPIEVDDWYIAHTIERCCCKEEANDITDKCKKVIATTDSSLIEGTRWGKEFTLPQLPQSFIKEFVERQGKDVDVLVEVELFRNYGKVKLPCSPHNNESNSDMSVYYPEIKLNSDNTVNLIFE